MDKDVVNRLVYSMIQFLQSQLDGGTDGGGLTEEGVESVEVAVQCLETAYGVSLAQTELAPPRSLIEIFAEATRGEGVTERLVQPETQKMDMAPPPAEATPDEKAEAETLKNEGNQLMRDEKFAEALDCYTKAISKDSRNAVYYCNRAAAHSKLNNHREAIEDCKRALQIEPQYSKAYGRMGLAHSSLNEHREAKECYQRALELEPDNESYRSNLAIAEEKLQIDPGQQQPRGNSLGGFAGAGGGGGFPFSLGNLAGLGGTGGPDLTTMLSNPGFMNMATQLMSDPNMQNMMSNLMGNMGGMGAGGVGGGAPAPANPPPNPPPPPPAGAAGGGGLEALLTAGRQLAEQMQTQHPDLVEQLRQQMNRGGPGGGAGNGQGDSGGNSGQDPSTPQ
ncbi:hypothetical protein Pcinc_035044 [Petrolisthes cinctipes]|uniref:SGTA homodimerisation domain-containing protein n=1 Tax=Petrolisthes cinctipes TaxID=88211 RepID=A0AAE1EPY2_PETCI|nr:hypothetical protein Pcinc_035044 [Petrolisthes cinctipes]